MSLTAKQYEGLKIAVARYRSGEKYTVISGYAGTGKSYLVKYIIDAIGLPEEKVAFVAYTGKASQVLKEKGNPNPTTLHKLLYRPIPQKNGSFSFKPKDSLDYSLVVVDEVSMVPGSMWRQLLSHDVYVIALGDPAQLSPVSTEDSQDVLSHPHVFLDEIMRQAQESEIVRLSMWIREGKSLESYRGDNEDVMVISQADTSMYEWADQILCAKNETRNMINNQYRKMLGFGQEPTIGDKVISLSNHWDCFSNDIADPVALTNGSIGTITRYNKDYVRYPYYICSKEVPILSTDIECDDGHKFLQMPIDYNSLRYGKEFLSGNQKYKIRKSKEAPPIPYDFTYAYAITVWKFQGSQANKVLLFEENFPWDRDEHQRYLYTGLTRAAEKCVIVKK